MAKAQIMVVEDESLYAEFLQDKLVALGYDVCAPVASGEEAVDRAEELKPDLVLMDINLAGEMDGIEAAEQIRDGFGIPVIYLTAYSDDETLQRAKLSGPYGYLLKPFRAAELQSTIQMALYKHEMERKLQESEAWYRALFEQAEDALILEDENREILDANQAASRLLGYTRQELLAMKTTDWEQPEIQSRSLLFIHSAPTRGTSENFETEIADRDGKRIPVEIIVTPLRIGQQVLFLSSIRDIAARKKSEEVSHRYAERLRTLHEIDQALLAARLPETIAVAAIRRIRRLIPCQRAMVLAVGEPDRIEMLAAELSDGVQSVADIDLYREVVKEKILSHGWVQGAEDLATLAHRSPLQESLYAAGMRSYILAPLFLEDKLAGALSLESVHPRAFSTDHIAIATEVAASLAVAIRQVQLHEQAQQEIAERMQVERALRESEERFRLLAENIDEVFWLFSPDERELYYVNPAYEAVVGRSCESLYAAPASWVDALHPEDRQRALDAMRVRRLESYDGVLDDEYRLVRPDGSIRWIWVRTKPVFDQAGEVLARTGVVADITARKLAEKVVHDAATTAERDRLARELHDAVTQTLFSASLIAEALPRVWDRYPEEGQRGLGEIRQLTRGALAELRTMLLELRPAALTEKPLDDLLRDLAQAVSGRARVPVTLKAEEGCSLPPKVQIALYRITQEALNNVAKHAEASNVSVELHGQPGWVTLRIQDDGRGFDPSDVLPDCMGLRIMQERATGIGAMWEIRSQPGRGTEIVIEWQGLEEG